MGRDEMVPSTMAIVNEIAPRKIIPASSEPMCVLPRTWPMFLSRNITLHAKFRVGKTPPHSEDCGE